MVDRVDIRDGVCAYLQGGLGNQLFIVAAAWAQAERLSCPLYIDVSRYIDKDPLEFANETKWDYSLEPLGLPGTVIGIDSPWFRNSPRRPKVIRQPGRNSGRLAVYTELPYRYDPAIHQICAGTTILGYFQSHVYFARVADRVRALFDGLAVSVAEQRILDDMKADPRVTVHMRRGDYRTPVGLAHHGIASGSYFGRALGLMASIAPGLRPRVFSDSPEQAAQELVGVAGAEFFDQPDALSTLATIKAMSLGRGFVMSNSSFSWWGAWLMSGMVSSPVIAPRPWVASGDSASDLLLPDWITLDAR